MTASRHTQPDPGAMRQRSFRLPAVTLAQLDDQAGMRNESTNALAQRLIEEGLRREQHPLVGFRDGASGRRAAIAGTRLDIWQVIETLRGSENSVSNAAAYLGIPEAHVRACVSYYADYADEIDAWRDRQHNAAERERERLERERALLA